MKATPGRTLLLIIAVLLLPLLATADQLIGRVSTVTELQNGIEVKVANVAIRVIALNPSVVRVTYAMRGHFGPDESFAVVHDTTLVAPAVHVRDSQPPTRGITFTNIMVADAVGKEGSSSHYLYRASDGVRLQFTIERFRSSTRAKEELRRSVARAVKVVEYNKRLSRTGKKEERAVLIRPAKEPSQNAKDPLRNAAVMWTSGAELHVVESPSLDHALLFEKTVSLQAGGPVSRGGAMKKKTVEFGCTQDREEAHKSGVRHRERRPSEVQGEEADEGPCSCEV